MGTITTLPDDATRNGGARNPLPFQLRWRQAIADDPDVSQSAVLCAHALSLWMNGNGRCSPGIAEIARRMHCSERTAQRALAKLEKYLAIEPGKGTKTPTGWTNLYIARDPEGVSRGDTSDKQGVTETTARGDNGEARGDNDDTKGCHQCHPNSYNSEFAPYGNSKKENSNGDGSFSETDSPESVGEEQTVDPLNEGKTQAHPCTCKPPELDLLGVLRVVELCESCFERNEREGHERYLEVAL